VFSKFVDRMRAPKGALNYEKYKAGENGRIVFSASDHLFIASHESLSF
jgi:hypothetical protein